MPLNDLMMILQGRDPEQEKKVKRDAETATANYTKNYGEAPEEEGVHEDDFLPPTPMPNRDADGNPIEWRQAMAPDPRMLEGGGNISKLREEGPSPTLNYSKMNAVEDPARAALRAKKAQQFGRPFVDPTKGK